MKKCKCGFLYKDKNDLEIVNLINFKGIVKYYCPECKAYKFTEKIKNNKEQNHEENN